jgi:Fic family protein
MSAKMYESPHQFEPLLPSVDLYSLQIQSARIVEASLKLTSGAHETARGAIRELVRSMNSYYSNRIEGQGTHPKNIESALRNDFSARPDIATLQRIALAHIAAEQELEVMVEQGLSPLSSGFLIAAHRALYAKLDVPDRTLEEDGQVIIPGGLRTETVTVARHIAPTPESVPRFLARMDEVYAKPVGWENLLINVACMHHRAAWVHPFRDGNGRATRLQSHCALWPLSAGLWSPSRGLARARDAYYAQLDNADQTRRGDLDGRGNLTASGLTEWVRFYLGVCEDQVNFMARLLNLDDMKLRIEALITFRAARDKALRGEAVLPLFHVFAAGPLSRSEFIQMTGLGERTARTLLSRLMATSLLVSDTALGPVRFGLPLDSLQFLLPEPYPEVNANLD